MSTCATGITPQQKYRVYCKANKHATGQPAPLVMQLPNVYYANTFKCKLKCELFYLAYDEQYTDYCLENTTTPLIQSQRMALYKFEIDRLISSILQYC